MVNWDDYRVFLQVARRGSLSGASKILKIDAATVGRRIARLETSLGVVLFNKLQRGYTLTQSGAELLREVESMESREKKAQHLMHGSLEGLSGTIRIAASDGLCNFVLPKIAVEICKKHPDLDIQIMPLPHVFSLSRREADITVLVTPPDSQRVLVRKITDYKLHLAAHQDYLDTHPPITKVSDLKDHRMVGYIPDIIFDSSLDYSSEITPNRTPNLSSNSVSVQMQIMRHQGGVSLTHDFVLANFKNFKRILCDEISMTRSFYLVRHKDDLASEQLNLISDIFANGIKSEIKNLEAQFGS